MSTNHHLSRLSNQQSSSSYLLENGGYLNRNVPGSGQTSAINVFSKQSTSKSKLPIESPLIKLDDENLLNQLQSVDFKMLADQDGIDDGSLEQKELLEGSPSVRNSYK